MANDGFRPDAEGLARILGSIEEFILVMDGEGRIVYMNRAQRGFDAKDFIGTLGTEVMPPDSQAVFNAALKRVLETGEPQVYEVIVTLPDAVDVWYRTWMNRFGGGDSEPQVLLVSRDVTAEKEAEAEAARLKKLLPMCAWCNRIRDDAGNWSRIETYLARREDTAISHGICPRCEEEHMGDGRGDGGMNGSAA